MAFISLFLVAAFGYVINWRAARAIASGGEHLHSVPKYHAIFSALTVIVPVLASLLLWLALRGPFTDLLIVQGLTPEQYWAHENRTAATHGCGNRSSRLPEGGSSERPRTGRSKPPAS